MKKTMKLKIEALQSLLAHLKQRSQWYINGPRGRRDPYAIGWNDALTAVRKEIKSRINRV